MEKSIPTKRLRSVSIQSKRVEAFARGHFAKIMDQVCEDHDPVIITRQNAQSVVLISLEDYQAIVETGYLLKNE